MVPCLHGAFGLCAVVAASCTGGQTECLCAASGVTLNVPPESAAAVTQVTASGGACTSATQTCEKEAPAGGCSTLLIVPQQPGTCHVEVDFADGTVFAADVPIVQTSGCCAGLYAHPPSAGQLDVPPPGAGDAAHE